MTFDDIFSILGVWDGNHDGKVDMEDLILIDEYDEEEKTGYSDDDYDIFHDDIFDDDDY